MSTETEDQGPRLSPPAPPLTDAQRAAVEDLAHFKAVRRPVLTPEVSSKTAEHRTDEQYRRDEVERLRGLLEPLCEFSAHVRGAVRGLSEAQGRVCVDRPR